MTCSLKWVKGNTLGMFAISGWSLRVFVHATMIHKDHYCRIHGLARYDYAQVHLPEL